MLIGLVSIVSSSFPLAVLPPRRFPRTDASLPDGVSTFALLSHTPPRCINTRRHLIVLALVLVIVIEARKTPRNRTRLRLA